MKNEKPKFKVGDFIHLRGAQGGTFNFRGWSEDWGIILSVQRAPYSVPPKSRTYLSAEIRSGDTYFIKWVYGDNTNEPIEWIHKNCNVLAKA